MWISALVMFGFAIMTNEKCWKITGKDGFTTKAVPHLAVHFIFSVAHTGL